MMMTRPPTPPIRPFRFFLVTYVVSWLIWLPLVLSRFGVGPIAIPQGTTSLIGLLGVLMPAVIALVLTGMAGGVGAVRRMLAPLRIWDTGWRWWAAAVLVWPSLLVLVALVYNLLAGDSPIRPAAGAASAASVAAFLTNAVFLLIATLGEEIGWRGLALPALESRSSAFRASTILGLGWAVWHIPYWLLQDTFTEYGIAYMALNLIFVMAGTYYITWFYNHGKFSLVLPVAFHVSFNIVNVAWLPVTASISAFAFLVGIDCLVAVLIARHLEPSGQTTRRAAV